MPAKKKGEKVKSKGGAKKQGSGRTPAIIDGVPLKTMTREQLEGHIFRLKNEIAREREERAFIESELERVQRLWNGAASSLEDTKTSLRLKDAEVAETEKLMLNESRANRRQVKVVIDECGANIGDLQIQSEKTILSLQQQHLEERAELVKEKEALRNQLLEEKASFLGLFANIKLKHSRDLEAQRSAFERETRQLEARSDERIDRLQQDLDLKRMSELTRLREEKSASLAQAIASHEGEIDRIKKESSEVTTANLRLIKQLRAQLAEQRSETLRDAQQKAKEEKERNSVIKELNQTKKQLADSQKLLERSERLQSSYKSAQTTLKTCQKDKRDLELQMQEIVQNTKKIESERDELYSNFVAVVADIHQRSQMKSTLLEKRLSELSLQLEKRDSVLSEVVRAANLDPKAFESLSGKFELIVEEKNRFICDLQEEVATARRTYAELLEKVPPSSGISFRRKHS